MNTSTPNPGVPSAIPFSPRVVVKPLSFTTPATIQPDPQTREYTHTNILPFIISYSVASSRLAELASHLTPAQAQTIDHLLHSVKQLSTSKSNTSLHTVQVPYVMMYILCEVIILSLYTAANNC